MKFLAKTLEKHRKTEKRRESGKHRLTIFWNWAFYLCTRFRKIFFFPEFSIAWIETFSFPRRIHSSDKCRDRLLTWKHTLQTKSKTMTDEKVEEKVPDKEEVRLFMVLILIKMKFRHKKISQAPMKNHHLVNLTSQLWFCTKNEPRKRSKGSIQLKRNTRF